MAIVEDSSYWRITDNNAKEVTFDENLYKCLMEKT